jgi:hypothetical protein
VRIHCRDARHGVDHEEDLGPHWEPNFRSFLREATPRRFFGPRPNLAIVWESRPRGPSDPILSFSLGVRSPPLRSGRRSPASSDVAAPSPRVTHHSPVSSRRAAPPRPLTVCSTPPTALRVVIHELPSSVVLVLILLLTSTRHCRPYPSAAAHLLGPVPIERRRSLDLQRNHISPLNPI